jgi:1-acyl-sn-glycerol-3-phosphate acyltransferase
VTVLRSFLFNVFFFAWCVVVLIGMTPLHLGSRRAMQKGVRFWMEGLRLGLKWIVGLDWEVRGRENIPPGPAVFACKHQSAWDTAVFYLLADDPAYVLKKELLSIPLWGWHARRAGMVAVDRGGGAGALKGMVRGVLKVLGEGRPVIIFPEGTRTAPGARRPYHPGVAAIYAQAPVPVVPVAVNSGLFWGRRSFVKRPGVVTLEFLPAIPPGLDRKAFMAELEARIETASERLRREALERFTWLPGR